MRERLYKETPIEIMKPKVTVCIKSEEKSLGLKITYYRDPLNIEITLRWAI